MPNKPKVDTREKRISELLIYCERLSAEKLALRKVLDLKLSVPAWQSLYDHEIQATRQKIEPGFHTLHALLREKDWRGLRDTLRVVLDKFLDED